MKTITELNEIDRKIQEGEYYNSYHKHPEWWVKVIWVGLSLLMITLFCLLTYGVIALFFNILVK